MESVEGGGLSSGKGVGRVWEECGKSVRRVRFSSSDKSGWDCEEALEFIQMQTSEKYAQNARPA